ncbi:MAG: HAD family hydrolase [Candidatus Heimdallarchaeota archaeon]|nr:MAG: HAD family hydrolase [Candidatus Heimdallarchaeota archaeon]
MTFDGMGVFFDLDGTLIDSMRSFYALVVHNLEQRNIEVSEESLKQVGSELLKDYQTPPSGQGIKLVFNLFWKIGRKFGLSRLKAIGFTYECASKARRVYHSAPLFPDTIKSLTLLHDAGFQLGIYTMASRKQLKESLRKHNIIQFFNPKGLISRDDVKRAKPDPEGLLLALENCSIHPSKGYFIGDMPIDIIAGNNAGTTTIGLTTGLLNKTTFQQYCQPTIIFDSLDHAIGWIMSKNMNIPLSS